MTVGVPERAGKLYGIHESGLRSKPRGLIFFNVGSCFTILLYGIHESGLRSKPRVLIFFNVGSCFTILLYVHAAIDGVFASGISGPLVWTVPVKLGFRSANVVAVSVPAAKL